MKSALVGLPTLLSPAGSICLVDFSANNCQIITWETVLDETTQRQTSRLLSSLHADRVHSPRPAAPLAQRVQNNSARIVLEVPRRSHAIARSEDVTLSVRSAEDRLQSGSS